MMNFGPIKLLFTAVAALLILGPKRLPGAVRAVGKALGELRKASAEVSAELRSGMEAEEHTPAQALPPPEELRPGPRA